jgi:hypothetical protein
MTENPTTKTRIVRETSRSTSIQLRLVERHMSLREDVVVTLINNTQNPMKRSTTMALIAMRTLGYLIEMTTTEHLNCTHRTLEAQAAAAHRYGTDTKSTQKRTIFDQTMKRVVMAATETAAEAAAAAAAALQIVTPGRKAISNETIMNGLEESVENHLVDCAVLVTRVTVRRRKEGGRLTMVTRNTKSGDSHLINRAIFVARRSNHLVLSHR